MYDVFAATDGEFALIFRQGEDVPVEGSKMGVNARNFAPSVLESAPVKQLDGASG